MPLSQLFPGFCLAVMNDARLLETIGAGYISTLEQRLGDMDQRVCNLERLVEGLGSDNACLRTVLDKLATRCDMLELKDAGGFRQRTSARQHIIFSLFVRGPADMTSQDIGLRLMPDNRFGHRRTSKPSGLPSYQGETSLLRAMKKACQHHKISNL